MTFKKSMLATAVGVALAGGSIGVASAAAIVSIKVMDTGSCTAATGTGATGFQCTASSTTLDGNSGGFKFQSAINPITYGGSTAWTGDAGTGTILFNTVNATGSFSTGFLFAGAPFIPYTFGSGPTGDITGTTMTLSSFNFGGNYAGLFNFNLPPDTANSSDTLRIQWVHLVSTGVYDVSFSWGHVITSAEDSSGKFIGQDAHWIVEGRATTTDAVVTAVPVPAAVWLLGSGLVGLAGVARRRKKA